MKPVQLLPKDQSAAKVATTEGPPTAIIAIIALSIAVLAGGGYFGMARLNTTKSLTQQALAEKTAAEQKNTEIQAQIDALGKPLVNGDKQIAAGVVSSVLAAYEERRNFVLLAKEVQGIIEGTGGWYTEAEFRSLPSADGGTAPVAYIQGIFPSEELAAIFDERANASVMLEGMETTKIETVSLVDDSTKKLKTYWKIEVYGLVTEPTDLEGILTNPKLVSDGGSNDGEQKISLEAEPKKKSKKAASAKAAPAKPAEPANPFTIAANSANGGK